MEISNRTKSVYFLPSHVHKYMDEMCAEWYTTFASNPSIIKRRMVSLLRHTVWFYTVSHINFWHFFLPLPLSISLESIDVEYRSKYVCLWQNFIGIIHSLSTKVYATKQNKSVLLQLLFPFMLKKHC